MLVCWLIFGTLFLAWCVYQSHGSVTASPPAPVGRDLAAALLPNGADSLDVASPGDSKQSDRAPAAPAANSSAAGVLTEAYRPGCRYWEIVSLGRRIVLVAASVFISNDSDVRATLAFVVCAGMLLLHLKFRPFLREEINRDETVCLMALMVVAGLHDRTAYNQATRTGFSVAVILLVAVVVVRLLARWACAGKRARSSADDSARNVQMQ